MRYLPIGDLARRANVRASALRHWEQRGLLPGARRHGGRREWPARHHSPPDRADQNDATGRLQPGRDHTVAGGQRHALGHPPVAGHGHTKAARTRPAHRAGSGTTSSGRRLSGLRLYELRQVRIARHIRQYRLTTCPRPGSFRRPERPRPTEEPGVFREVQDSSKQGRATYRGTRRHSGRCQGTRLVRSMSSGKGTAVLTRPRWMPVATYELVMLSSS